MEFKYTLEQVEKAGQIVELALGKNGFREKKVEIEKITPKKIMLKEQVVSKGTYRNQLFHEEVGANIEYVGSTVGQGRLDTLYVSKSVLILEKDVEKAKEAMKDLAKKKIQIYIEQLNEQHKVLSI